jgi:DNA-binding MarR family transcriptional regulator
MLKVLMVGGPISQIQLGEELGIDKASMVKAIDELEKLNYLHRVPHPTDRRVKLVELTPKGESLLRQCNKSKDKVEREFFKGLAKKDEAKFREIVRKLAELHKN